MKNVASPRTIAAVSVLIRRVLAQDGSVVPRPRNRVATTEYLLFYDGRSHSNPGAGGSGAIVLKIGLKELKVCWIGHMSYARSSVTTNVAKYTGLLIGLKACKTKQYEPLHVIGDKAIITQQHKRHNPPKAPHLKQIYWRSRRIADQLNVTNWWHHDRSHNQMAGTLATLAIQTRHSVQVYLTGQTTQLQSRTQVLQHLDGGVAEWHEFARNTTQDSVVADTMQESQHTRVKQKLGPIKKSQRSVQERTLERTFEVVRLALSDIKVPH
ncbi:unnamed protein product [Phytophthora fragariaefolia]|uniref:Unnamed protein product n=1 Tax=Phytophthora fragariaefolia TaxID=1490495 RepID=A0A9W6Y724_9STRA|nr:unnamed protein product [Phytophthora fragariaefolia]